MKGFKEIQQQLHTVLPLHGKYVSAFGITLKQVHEVQEHKLDSLCPKDNYSNYSSSTFNVQYVTTQLILFSSDSTI